jgi:hypothetical protein
MPASAEEAEVFLELAHKNLPLLMDSEGATLRPSTRRIGF